MFDSIGIESARKFSAEKINTVLKELSNVEKYGVVLRAKGIVDSCDGEWIYFDYIPEEIDIRRGAPDFTGKICVIGSKLDQAAIKKLFEV